MQLLKKIAEVVLSVIPIFVIVLILHFTIAPLLPQTMGAFSLGAVLVVLGLAIFNFGADIGVVPMGEAMGSSLTKSRKLWLITFFGFLTGFMVTMAEPDLQVLASQVFQASSGAIAKMLLMATVSVGVGFYVVCALLRIIFQVPLATILRISYLIIFALAGVVGVISPDFLAVAFDSGGVTTGPMTVPFILALGLGVASARGDRGSQNDSFGLVALASAGPIIAVLILGLLFSGTPSTAVASATSETVTQISSNLLAPFLHVLPEEIRNVALALSPMVAIFLIMQMTFLKLPRRQVYRITMGLVYTFVGLVLFLTGVNAGFSAAAVELGKALAAVKNNWILVPVGVILGLAVVSAEPAVYVLNQQVEEVSLGHIKRRIMLASLSLSVGLSVGLAMIRVLTGISLWWFIIPGYAVAMILMKNCPPLFTAIAFDSGGVATGPMTATFILSVAVGATHYLGGNTLTDAFGVVALVAMTPLITIQILGHIYRKKEQKAKLLAAQAEETE